MAQDLSRSAFDPAKHYSSVGWQQGRLPTDDDLNDSDTIGKEAARLALVDVVGPDGSPDDGFQISQPMIAAGSIDFSLAAGAMYVGGLRATLEAPETYALQKDWLEQAASERQAPAAERTDLVYLEVWQQPVTAVEDSELHEIALNAGDTSIRKRIMRRVHVLPNVATDSCAAAWAKLGQLGPGNEKLSDATLAVGPVVNTDPANLCTPAAVAGYLGAENQAIRVELGSPGKFRWSFDNASPLYRVELTKDVNGKDVIHFLTPPKDEVHWPLAGQTVEILPWSALLPNNEKVAEMTGGFLSIVSASYDPDAQTIAVNPVVPATFGATWQSRGDHAAIAGNPPNIYLYLRVWNHGDNTDTATETAFTPNVAVELPGTGLAITLNGTQFNMGDYWIIAARPDDPGKVVPWRLSPTGMRAEGVRRFYAPLGLIHWKPATGLHVVFDCRKVFLPLTKQRGCCIQIAPKSGWEHVLDEIADETDVCLCFQPGDYYATRTLVLRNAHVQVHGAGNASRIHGNGLKTVFLFDGCSSVEMKDLAVLTAGNSLEPVANKPHLKGAVTVRNCDDVRLSDLAVRTASRPTGSTSCIALYNEFAADRCLAAVARVEGCELVVGANQNGISVINFGRSTICDNDLRVDPTENAQIPAWWLQDKGFRSTTFRRAFVSNSHVDGPAVTPPKEALRLTLNPNAKAWILTPAILKTAWPKAIGYRPYHPKLHDNRSVREYFNGLASSMIFHQGEVNGHKIPEVENYLATLLGLRTAATKVRLIAAEGIVVGGTVAGEVRVSGNSVRDFTRGIHVGVSHHSQRKVDAAHPPDFAGRVEVRNNAVYVTLMPESVVERHGIFVGNAASVLIEDNRVACEKLGNAANLTIEGIHIYGFMGNFGYVTRNHMSGCTTGVRFQPIYSPIFGDQVMWRATENLAIGAAAAVVADSSVYKSGNMP